MEKALFRLDFQTADNLSGGIVVPVSKGRLLLSEQGWSPFSVSEWGSLGGSLNRAQHCIGHYRDQPCIAVEVDQDFQLAGYEWGSLRSVLTHLDESLYQMAARALQIVHWHLDHQFCGRCGKATEVHRDEMAKWCSHCDRLFYPRLSPCVIMLVVNGDHCLLAHNARFPEGVYSTLAGFIEPGETIEMALRREVHEEVGVIVDSPTYFGSQSWPFPDQLMIGFYAQYQSGDIRVDGVEIDHANWYRYDELPLIPPPHTIAGRLINEFVNRFRT